MINIDLCAGTTLDDAACQAYNKAVHGHAATFRFNGVQVIMFPDSENITKHCKYFDICPHYEHNHHACREDGGGSCCGKWREYRDKEAEQ